MDRNLWVSTYAKVAPFAEVASATKAESAGQATFTLHIERSEIVQGPLATPNKITPKYLGVIFYKPKNLDKILFWVYTQ